MWLVYDEMLISFVVLQGIILKENGNSADAERMFIQVCGSNDDGRIPCFLSLIPLNNYLLGSSLLRAMELLVIDKNSNFLCDCFFIW